MNLKSIFLLFLVIFSMIGNTKVLDNNCITLKKTNEKLCGFVKDKNDVLYIYSGKKDFDKVIKSLGFSYKQLETLNPGLNFESIKLGVILNFPKFVGSGFNKNIKNNKYKINQPTLPKNNKINQINYNNNKQAIPNVTRLYAHKNNNLEIKTQNIKNKKEIETKKQKQIDNIVNDLQIKAAVYMMQKEKEYYMNSRFKIDIPIYKGLKTGLGMTYFGKNTFIDDMFELNLDFSYLYDKGEYQVYNKLLFDYLAKNDLYRFGLGVKIKKADLSLFYNYYTYLQYNKNNFYTRDGLDYLIRYRKLLEIGMGIDINDKLLVLGSLGLLDDEDYIYKLSSFIKLKNNFSIFSGVTKIKGKKATLGVGFAMGKNYYDNSLFQSKFDIKYRKFIPQVANGYSLAP